MRVIRWFNLVLALGLLLIFGAVGCSSGSGSSSSSSTTSVAPSITTSPSAQSVTVGDPVTFTVVAAGTAPLSYQWYQGTTPVGGNNPFYSITSAQLTDAGNYTVTVTNGTAPTATSTAVALTVNPAVLAPAITTYPADQSVVTGSSASFSVVATGSAPLSYQWHLDNVNVGAGLSTYGINPATAIGNHMVSVTVSNAAGSVTSNIATLTVTSAPVAPTITTAPSLQSVTVGDPVTFSVVASGTAPLSYQWYLNGSAISGATADYYTISSAQTTGNYTVTVSNGTAPAAISTAVALTVNPVVVAPVITTYPSSQSVVTGSSANFSVVATGSATLSYQWHLDNVNVGTDLSTYSSPSMTATGGHTVTVTVTNAAGSVVSNPAALTVTAAPVAPSISTPPTTQSVTAGDPVTFTVTAAGTAPLSYQWYQGPTAVGGNSPFYTLSSAQSANAGSYTVTVSNGTAPAVTSTPVTLTVNAAPLAPTIQSLTPLSQSVLSGSGATFTVAATGAAPLFYQWQLNGSNVSSNSATYTSDATLAAGSYDVTVTVTNAVSSATSGTVTLTVGPLVVTLPGSLPLSMTPIAAGTFTMGAPASDPDFNINGNDDEGPQHQVTISQNFYMGTYLLTQAQWLAVMGSNPSHFNSDGTTGTSNPTNPVETVSYTDITTASTGFLALLNAEKATICPLYPTNYEFRLPTEAEWEYACRAGTATRFYWGDYPDSDTTTINSYAWYSGNDGSTTEPVGGKTPNAWGLYDMAGNVFEWCQDWYGAYDSGPDTDPAGPTSGSYRVYRGGCWQYDSNHCRSAYRNDFYPDFYVEEIGFRVVLAPPRIP